MQTTTRVVIDLLSGGYSEPVHAVQGDAYSRAVELDIRQQKARWPIPSGLAVVVEYHKPDGTKGVYDTLPDGSAAWSAEENILTVRLAPQMLTVPGTVAVQVRMMKGDAVLSLFKFHVFVHQKLTGGTSEDYINLNAFLPQVMGAKVGQHFEIEEVDETGRVTKIRAVDAPQGGGGDIPETLPNPKSLTFKGAVEATYDGSEAVEVEIPQGGGTEPTGAEKIVEYTVDADGASAKTFSFTVEAYPKLAEYNRLRGIVKRKTNAGMPYVQVTLNTTTINYNAVAKVDQGTMGMMGFDVVRKGNYYTGNGKGPTNISFYTGWKTEGRVNQSGAGNLLPLYVPELKSINIISYSTFLDEGATIEIWGWNE